MPATRTNRLLIGAAAAVGVLAGAAGITSAVTGAGEGSVEPTVSQAEAEQAAVAEVPGTATRAELELDDGGEWTVEVDGDDGQRHEVDVDATTGAVTGRETDDDGLGDDGPNDDDDVDDREGDPALAAEATVTQAEAEQIATTEVPGTVHRSTIEREDGRVVWDVEVDGDDGLRHDFQVDATTGDIVEHDIDD